MNTKTISETEIQKKVLNSISDIRNIILSEDIMISKHVVSKSSVQKYIFHNKNCNISDNIIKKLILDAALKAEYASAGSGDLCLKISSKIIPDMLRLKKSGISHIDIIKTYEEKFESIEDSISRKSRKFNHSDFHILLENRFKTNIEREIVEKVIDNFNTKSSIFLEKSNQEETSINRFDGFSFNISVSKEFLDGKPDWKEKEVKCIIIDGTIESVGEIHHLLEKASSTKEPHIVFARHISEDVRRTILLNLKRGTINLIPVEIGFDENTLNILNDLAVACDSDVVSSYKGDLISSSVKSELPIVDEIHILNNTITILNNPDSEILASHIKYLKSKRDKCYETKYIYENRLRSLSSGKLVLKIGNRLLLKNKDMIENFDHFFREIKSYIQYGSLICEDIEFDNFIEMEEIFKRYNIISPVSAYFAIKNAMSLSSNVLSIGKAIVSES